MKISLIPKIVFPLFSPDARIRYEGRHYFLSALAKRWGFRVYSLNRAWFRDQDYLRIWRNFPQSNEDVHERKFILHSVAKSLRHIPGDIAECGVFRGGSSFMMLSASQGTGKRLYGFDSFEGLSTPTDQDSVREARTFAWKAHDLSVGEEIAAKNLRAFEGSFTLYKGWIPERFPEVSDKKFSLVHIDVDLYQPTLDTLAFFYPRLNPGGMIVCDDYGSEACPGAFKAMNEYAEKTGRSVIHLTTGQGLLIKA